MKIDMIAFDADDTLWHNETLFKLTHQRFAELLSNYHDADWIEKKLFETEMRNLEYFGYGIKGFTLSMIETAIQLTESRITGSEIQKIINFARRMVKAPVELLQGAAETVKTLAKTYELMIITKGDLFDQESKIARSELSGYFKYIEILTDKTKAAYKAVLRKYGIDRERFVMIGNSLKSDILPVLQLGGHAVYIPYPLCWQHEKVDETELDKEKYTELENISQLPALIEKLASGPTARGAVNKTHP